MEVYDHIDKLALEINNLLATSLKNGDDLVSIQINRLIREFNRKNKYDSKIINRLNQKIQEAYSINMGIASLSTITDATINKYYKGIISQLPKEGMKQYEALQKQADILMNTGQHTQQQASEIVSEAFKGVTVKDASNRRVKVETIVKRHIRDVQREQVNNISEKINERYGDGNNVFWISHHPKPRPKCSKDERKYVSDTYTGSYQTSQGTVDVTNWNNTSFGQPDGLFGYNCRHVKWAVNGYFIQDKASVNLIEKLPLNKTK